MSCNLDRLRDVKSIVDGIVHISGIVTVVVRRRLVGRVDDNCEGLKVYIEAKSLAWLGLGTFGPLTVQKHIDNSLRLIRAQDHVASVVKAPKCSVVLQRLNSDLRTLVDMFSKQH